MSQNIDLNLWADCLRAWPNPPESWITWYSRVAKTHMPLWQDLNIANALSLSLTPLDKDENLLKTIGYFWSDALNCFLFGHGPMTITLLDVAMITGLDISSPNPAAHNGRSPLQTFFQSQLHKLGHLHESAHENKRPSD